MNEKGPEAGKKRRKNSAEKNNQWLKFIQHYFFPNHSNAPSPAKKLPHTLTDIPKQLEERKEVYDRIRTALQSIFVAKITPEVFTRLHVDVFSDASQEQLLHFADTLEEYAEHAHLLSHFKQLNESQRSGSSSRPNAHKFYQEQREIEVQHLVQLIKASGISLNGERKKILHGYFGPQGIVEHTSHAFTEGFVYRNDFRDKPRTEQMQCVVVETYRFFLDEIFLSLMEQYKKAPYAQEEITPLALEYAENFEKDARRIMLKSENEVTKDTALHVIAYELDNIRRKYIGERLVHSKVDLIHRRAMNLAKTYLENME